MTLNLRMHPQTALLLAVDTLMSTGKVHKVELYVEPQTVAGAVFELDDNLETGKFITAANDLPELLTKLMQYLQASEAAASEPAVEGEPKTPATSEELEAAAAAKVLASADATGVPG